MTLDKIESAIKAAEEKREKTNADITRLTKEQKELEAAAQSAAEAGDLDEYIRLHKDAERKAAEVFVTKQHAVKAGHGATTAEILDAWNDYAAKFETKQKARLDAYIKAKQDLYKQFNDLMAAQNAAYKYREMCAKWLGRQLTDIDNGEKTGLPIYDTNRSAPEGMLYHGNAWACAEMPYFKEVGADDFFEDKCFRIFSRHRYCE